MKAAPWLLLSARILPPCFSAMCLHSASPSPVPSYWFLECSLVKVLKMVSEYFGSKPMPLSEIFNFTAFLFCVRLMEIVVALACFKILFNCSCTMRKMVSLISSGTYSSGNLPASNFVLLARPRLPTTTSRRASS